MGRNLEKDLQELDNFFNLHYRTKNGFANSIEFETYSADYARVLKDAIDRKNFGLFDAYTDIKEIVNSDVEIDASHKDYRKYRLKITFDMSY